MDANAIDILWLVLAAALVMLMQAGFLCLETGFTRSKNSINVAVKNLADFGLSVLLFWVVGFGLMFGATRGGWIGGDGFANDFAAGPTWDAAFFLYQLMFCGTAVTIVSGAVAERIRFGGYLYVTAIVALSYPVFGHWAWGGALSGNDTWLSSMGFVDFAGSTVVHGVGGWFALIACVVVGPRMRRFDRDGRPHSNPGSNLPVAMLGVLLLWFGWIGFNGGSTLSLDGSVPGIVLNTVLAAAAGMLAAAVVGWLVCGYPQPGWMINGTIAGLVAITACCHCVSTPAALLVGAVGGLVCQAACALLLRLRIDDVISAAPAHLAAGIWGTLAVGLLGNLDTLGTGLTRWQQIEVQALGVTACAAVCLGIGVPTLWLGHRLFGLRVSRRDEKRGLNVAEHHAPTELYEFATVLQRQARTRDLSARLPVEPFTEVGQIAERYNALMDVLQQTTTDVTELKATERLLRRAKREAEEANHAKSEFLANMSHEVRTPLHGILSFAGFGRRRAADTDAKLHGYFEKIDQSGQRLLVLVNDLLDLAKLESGRLEFEMARHDIGNVVACVVDEFESLLSERSIDVRFDQPATPTSAVADRDKLMQVLRNLLNNAMKFSPAGGVIEVGLALRGGAVRLTVRDDGPGIPADELEAVFDKFVQSSKTKSAAGGTGLGLAICRQIVQGHAGGVWAENAPDGGAVFVVEWPKNAGRPDTAPAMPEAA
ncbi:MAG: ammonium transporter [Planctomycetota bacterium]